jgi:hypothetical protein
MIIGRDLLSQLAIDMSVTGHKILWDKVTLPMKKNGTPSRTAKLHMYSGYNWLIMRIILLNANILLVFFGKVLLPLKDMHRMCLSSPFNVTCFACEST